MYQLSILLCRPISHALMLFLGGVDPIKIGLCLPEYLHGAKLGVGLAEGASGRYVLHHFGHAPFLLTYLFHTLNGREVDDFYQRSADEVRTRIMWKGQWQLVLDGIFQMAGQLNRIHALGVNRFEHIYRTLGCVVAGVLQVRRSRLDGFADVGVDVGRTHEP